MGKIIHKPIADKLIANGLARIEGRMYDERKDATYAIVTRLDEQRTDHYRVGNGDLRE